MKRIKTFGLLLLLVACCPAHAPRAQGADGAGPFARIERALREKEPAWKVESIRSDSSTDPAKQSIVLRSGKNQAGVEVWVWRREQDARDVFAAEATAFDNQMGRRMVEGSVPGLGDESHIWTNRGTTAWPTIKFRKGTVNVTVFAPSVAVARRFARHVLEQLNAG